MKIGIITYHRSYNYGATLQAIATRVFLAKNGYNVFYIDYFPDYHKSMYQLFDKVGFEHMGLYARIKYLKSFIKHYKEKKKRISVYDPYVKEYIEPFCLKTEMNIYDAVIYGSDQIWRKQTGLGNKFNPYYFGDNDIKCDINISYAASMGNMNLSEKDKVFLHSTLSKFKCIGVREKSLFNLVHSLNLNNISLTIDPTFLLEANEWDKILFTKRLINASYCFYYCVRSSFRDRDVNEFCRAKGLKLIRVNSFHHPKGSNYNPNPSEFVSLIKYADYVLTSSFHGLAFSVIYKKEVIVSLKSNSERLLTLMDNIGIVDHFLSPHVSIPTDLNKIDYDKVYGLLDDWKVKSKEFLLQSL